MTGEQSSEKRRLIAAAFRWLGRQLFPVWVIVWINALFLRLTVRDSIDLLAPLYYATPWPVLAALTLPFVFVVWRNPKMVLAVIVVAHLFAGAWLLESWRSDEPAKGGAELKVVQWNVNRPIRRLPGTAERIRQFDADVLTIAEPLTDDGTVSDAGIEKIKEDWRRELPGYQSVFPQGNLLMLVRGVIEAARHDDLGDGSIYSLYDVDVKGHAFRVLQVDLYAGPTSSRREPLNKLVTLAESLRDKPLIIAGDFNTPRDSVFLQPLRTHHTHAWEAAGTRGADTWPWPVPVLSLDQIWSNDWLKPIRCRTGGSWRSDHLWMEAEFVFRR